MKKIFKKALDVTLDQATLTLHFGEELFHPEETERRYLKDIRSSLLDPNASGPEVLYNIAMDVGKKEHHQDLKQRSLLYGIVAYSDGKIGQELVRSQGHIHAVSASCNYSTPEVYEIWQGEAYIYMQEFAEDDPGRCAVIKAKAGDIVIVPPNWAHYTVNANQHEKMLFGAWCIRDFAFEYKQIREKQGLAFYPVVVNNQVNWLENKKYSASELIVKEARDYPEFNLSRENLYTQYEEDHSKFDFVTDPLRYQALWDNFQV